MQYLSEMQLSENSNLVYTESSLVKAASTSKITIFLSHSHQDLQLIKGLIKIMKQYGIDLYIDSLDPSLPSITNRQTAEMIKNKIKNIEYFWVLATTNALNSKWVPWEIGFADSIKNSNKMFIIPVSDRSGKFNGNEYLQLYSTIALSQITSSQPLRPTIYNPITKQSTLLSDVFKEVTLVRTTTKDTIG